MPKQADKPQAAKPVTIRVPKTLADEIDAVRGLVPRDTYVRDLVERALAAQKAGRL